MSVNKYGTKWTEEETILVFYYYCRIPFGKITARNPEIIRIAELIGRTPAAVSYKMGNLGHFDPELQKRKISGLKNVSKLDKQIVELFYNDWEELAFKAYVIEEQFRNNCISMEKKEEELPAGNDTRKEVKLRINQSFFRDTVLTAYGNRCCISGISIPSLLIASHIKPWKDSDPKTERTNPCNGLSLNALHDKAFDKGLITVMPDYIIRVSSKLNNIIDDTGISWLRQYENQAIMLPEKFAPAKAFLEYHNDVVFIP